MSAVPIGGARCLVLGGGGFIGTNVCNALACAGAEVEGYGRRSIHTSTLDSFPWHAADFADCDSVRRAVAGKDVVIHLLGGSVPAESNQDPISDVEMSLLPSLRLIEECRRAGVRRLIFASSGGTVYGVTGREPTREAAPTDPITAYGINKLAVEKYLGLNRRLHNFDSIVLRIANPYGPFQFGRRQQGVVGSLMMKALTGEPIDIWGDGSVVRDFIHIDDVARAVVAAIVYDGPVSVFNVGSGVGRALGEVAEAVWKVTGYGKVQIRYLAGRPVDVPFNVLDIARITEETGWTPLVDWEEGLSSTAAWMKQAISEDRLVDVSATI